MASYLGGAFKDFFVVFHIFFIDTWGNDPQFEEHIFLICLVGSTTRGMVLDEFHESESWKTAVREVMKSLGATHRWGLSGTPPLNSTDSVLEVAELLWYATDGGPDAVLSPAMSKALKYRQSTKTAAKSWLAKTANQEEVQKECQVMIRDFVRQNESTLVKAGFLFTLFLWGWACGTCHQGLPIHGLFLGGG